MNLADILLPDHQFRASTGAQRAQRAQTQQRRGLESAPTGARRGADDALNNQMHPNAPPGARPETLATSGFAPNAPNAPTPMAEIEKPLPITAEYFSAQGVELLPEDRAFLSWHLPKGTARRNAFIRCYIGTWLKAMEGELLGQRKQNAGRRAANTWLRLVGG